MTKCAECQGDISTLAATCPHCGAPNVATPQVAPKKFAGKKKSSAPVVIGAILFIVVLYAVMGPDGNKTADTTAQAAQTDNVKEQTATDLACKTDLQCWGEKNLVTASVYCADTIERLAKFTMRWTDGTFETKFSKWAWLDKDAGTLSYFGDKAEFQNGFGAYQVTRYQCDINPTTKDVFAARAEPGRL